MIVLDSHVVIWLALEPEKLSLLAADTVRKAESAREEICISTGTFFEIANAVRRQRVTLKAPEKRMMDEIRSRFRVIPISEEIALCAGRLPEPFHGDPMDRLIAATAIVHKATLVTADGRIQRAALCRTIW